MWIGKRYNTDPDLGSKNRPEIKKNLYAKFTFKKLVFCLLLAFYYDFFHNNNFVKNKS